MPTTLSEIGYRTGNPNLASLYGQPQSTSAYTYAQLPSNYVANYEAQAQAPSAAATLASSYTPTYARGPQAIPLGTPGTYVSPGGRVLPESYKPIAAAQRAFAAGAGGNKDMQTYMAEQGFANPAPGGTIAGGPSEGWNWNTMSTPYMDWAAGKLPNQDFSIRDYNEYMRKYGLNPPAPNPDPFSTANYPIHVKTTGGFEQTFPNRAAYEQFLGERYEANKESAQRASAEARARFMGEKYPSIPSGWEDKRWGGKDIYFLKDWATLEPRRRNSFSPEESAAFDAALAEARTAGAPI